MKRLVVAALAAAGLSLGLAAPALAAGPSLCIHGSVTVNGMNQTVDQCLPPGQ